MARLYDSRRRMLVTGGVGFLRSHLIDRLMEQGHEILCLDNLFTGTKRNIDHLHNHPRFEFMRHDGTLPLNVEVDEPYNLARPASPVHSQHDPVQTSRPSVHGAIKILGLAKRLRCKIFQSSTSGVYGDPSVHPRPEACWGNMKPISIRSCCDESKRCAETLFFDHHRQHDLAIKVVRIFNTYGPRMHHADGRVVSTFIVRALSGHPITISRMTIPSSAALTLRKLKAFLDGSRRYSSTKALAGPSNTSRACSKSLSSPDFLKGRRQ